MTGDHPRAASTATPDDGPRWRSLLASLSFGRRRRRLTVAAALAAVLPLVLARLALNAPVALPGPSVAGSVAALEALATAGPALAAVAIGLTRADLDARVGLLAAGVFGLLAVVDDAAALPAASALAVAGALVLRPWLPLGAGSRMTDLPTAAVAGALAVGLAGSLLAAAGVVPAGIGGLGAVAVACGLTGLPLAVRPANRLAWLVGVGLAAAVVGAGVAAPFVTGATVLVVSGAVGVPVALLALGAGGVATVTADAALRGRVLPATGGLLLLSAGVPGSIQRAVAFVLGASLVLAHAGELTAADGDGSGVIDRE